VFDLTELDILIAGDTHYERLEYEDHTLIVNSGSLTLPHNQTVRLGSVVLLEITRDGVHAEIIPLGETPGLKNPTRPAHVDIDRGGRIVSASYNGEAIELANGTPFLVAPTWYCRANDMPVSVTVTSSGGMTPSTSAGGAMSGWTCATWVMSAKFSRRLNTIVGRNSSIARRTARTW